MSLKKRIEQIAAQTVKGYVSTLTAITQNNVSNGSLSGSVRAAQIQAFSNGQYVVVYADNTLERVNAGGLKPVGPGDTVLVANGVIIG